MKIWIGIFLGVLLLWESLAFGGPALSPSFVYQGTLYNEAGTAVVTDTVNFTLEIYNSSGSCLLYEEAQNNVNLALSNGEFSLAVGSAVGSTARVSGVDPGLTMQAVFSNAVPFASSTFCSGGYTPLTGDARVLRVKIFDTVTSATDTLSPDQFIGSVPSATVAQTIQGTDLSGLLKDSFIVTDRIIFSLGRTLEISLLPLEHPFKIPALEVLLCRH